MTSPDHTLAPAGRRFVPLLTALLCAATFGLAPFVAELPEPSELALLAALVASVLFADLVDLDLFGRGAFTPGTVATIALAVAFGPAGPLVAELAVAAESAARRKPVSRWSFDFGALSLCGIAAAGASAAASGLPGGMLTGAALAGVAYYVVNAVLLSAVWSLDEGLSPWRAFKERLAWAAPHYAGYGLLAGLLLLAERATGLYVFAIAGVLIVMLWLGQKQYLDRTRDGVEELRASHAELERANQALRDLLAEKEGLLERIRLASVATVASLARTIEAKDRYTAGHTERVAEYSVQLARELGLEGPDLEAVALGGVIHDVGKVGVRDQVLLKPGKLDPAEWVEMRRHPEISSYILEGLELPLMAKQIARHHHERFDGTGYPDRLAGEEIPLAARILAVADTLDAMTSTRPYRAALSFDAALAELRRHSGTQFCPRVVAALDRSLAEQPEAWERARNVEPIAAAA